MTEELRITEFSCTEIGAERIMEDQMKGLTLLAASIGLSLLMGGAHASEVFPARDDVMNALEASYEALSRAHLDMDGKFVSITFEGSIIKVSFLNSKPAFGGQAHVEYDFEKRLVVGIRGEQ